jgi:cysteine desulfurase
MTIQPDRLYLDHAATTPIDPAVAEAMAPFVSSGEQFGNPSSLHRWGKLARKAMGQARETLAECLNTTPEEWVFTSGGTEANNLAILGLAHTLAPKGKHIIVSAIEHSAVTNPAKYLQAMGWEVTFLPVTADGVVELDTLQAACRPDTVLVSVMHGNNEVGSIQPIQAMGQLLQARGIAFHTDAVQTAGKLPINLADLAVDYLSISSHKLYGPKGGGALFVRASAPKPSPLLFGGGQEEKLRSGTENVATCVGLAEALRLCQDKLATETPRLRALQAQWLEQLPKAIPTAVLNGPALAEHRVPGNLNFSFPPIEGEALVLNLDLKGIGVSSGSACHTGKIEPSHVVMALGRSVPEGRSTIRFSLGRASTQAHLTRVLDVLPAIVDRLTPKKAGPIQ